ncbi:MAG TPA: spore cortex biosynthesis protein YabQ [Candidatus Merdivicinus intestinigallinarum]|nr:spore cortex biosynthesis protein YabQ [Candidatus Merdivicinus intestinigallinarum]
MGFAPETAVFLYACALGAGLGVLYDVFRLLRLVTGGKALLVFLEDLLFSFLAAGCTLYFMIEFCSGWLRLFVLAGEALGFILYHFTVGEIVIRLLRLICRGVRFLLLGIWRKILYPPLRILLLIVQKIKHLVVAISQKFGKPLFFQNLSLQLHPKMMYNENNSNQTDTGKDG